MDADGGAGGPHRGAIPEALTAHRVAPDVPHPAVADLEGATRRYLAAIRELARVRKLQAGAPPVQVNTQVNVLRG